MPRVSAHERLNITRNFGPYERLIPGIEISYICTEAATVHGRLPGTLQYVINEWCQFNCTTDFPNGVYRGGMFYGTMGMFCLFVKWRGQHILLTGGGVFREV